MKPSNLLIDHTDDRNVQNIIFALRILYTKLKRMEKDLCVATDKTASFTTKICVL